MVKGEWWEHATKKKAPIGAVEAKAKAFEVGIQFAKDLLIHDFFLEGDSLMLVNALNELTPPPLSVAVIVSSSLSTFNEFRRVDVSHVKRKGNSPAHLLAKYALGISDFSVWVEESPGFLDEVDEALLQDVLLASSIQ